MISDDVLAGLVPREPPGRLFEFLERAELRAPGQVSRVALQIFAWSIAIRDELRRATVESSELRAALDSTGMIGVGIYRTLGLEDRASDLPSVGGYRLGAMLFDVDNYQARDQQAVPRLPLLALGDYIVPVVRTSAYTDLQSVSAGRVAATFATPEGLAGITAGHVVNGSEPGQWLPALRWHGQPTRLLRRAPGMIDAAAVGLTCGCVDARRRGVRSAVQGEHVVLRLAEDMTRDATVMMTVESSAELLSAAMPRHFLLSEHGHEGHSGSSVCTSANELCGMYLGRTRASDPTGASQWYGYALDIEQAARVLAINPEGLGECHG